MLPDLEEGGVEWDTLDIGRFLAAHGHRSIVISAGGRMVQQLEKDHSTHITMQVGVKSPACLRFFFPLRRLLLRERADVLHLRSRVPAWLGYLVWKSLPNAQRPALVTTFHGFYSVNKFSAIMAKGQRVIAISKAIEDHIARHYGAREKTTLIYGGIDENVFHSDRVGKERILRLTSQWGFQKTNRPVVMLPGRLARLKGPDVFIHSLSLLEGLPFDALLVGDIEENPGLTAELGQLVKKYGLENRILMTGRCSDMPAALALADIVVSASSSQPEAFGRTTVEAMAMEKPVIATAHGGSLETVQENVTGWLVAPSDPKAMAAALTDALKDAKKRQRFGRAGRERVLKHFTLRAFYENTERVYKELVQQRGDR
ncbi:MAG: glycosyltransferase [Desulfobulbaceae bacterium]|nr:MAG: glycosyltransferase [Desulfobulbaceae bacterium]